VSGVVVLGFRVVVVRGVRRIGCGGGGEMTWGVWVGVNSRRASPTPHSWISKILSWFLIGFDRGGKVAESCLGPPRRSSYLLTPGKVGLKERTCGSPYKKIQTGEGSKKFTHNKPSLGERELVERDHA